MSSESDSVTRIIERHFDEDGGVLQVGGIDVRDIAERHGTPVYIYDARTLDRTWAELSLALPECMEVFYSIKANPNQVLLRYFLQKGCGLEIGSGGELHQALAAGCEPDKLVFAGPGKTRQELTDALKRGVGEIHVESQIEIEAIANIARDLDLKARIALRINPTADVLGGAMRMGGKPATFGIDEEILEEVAVRVMALETLVLTGVHLFTGTQILDVDILIDNYQKAIELAQRISDVTSAAIETVDFGGGLGIPYFAHEHPLDLQEYGRRLQQLIETTRKNSIFANTRFIIEPGRFLIGEAGIYLIRVIEVKRSRGKRYVVTDGGMHHHLAASGNLGQTIKRNYPISAVNKLNADTRTCDIVGPLCTPLDVLARDIELPAVEEGDLIGVFQSGAYARTASPLDFLSHASPPEIWIESGNSHTIRRRGDYADFLRDQCAIVPTDKPS